MLVTETRRPRSHTAEFQPDPPRADKRPLPTAMDIHSYRTDGFYDEIFESDGRPRPQGELLVRRLAALSDGELQRRQKSADLALLNMGITFNVYGHEAGTEKIWPFDIIPRIIEGQEWNTIERGLKQ